MRALAIRRRSSDGTREGSPPSTSRPRWSATRGSSGSFGGDSTPPRRPGWRSRSRSGSRSSAECSIGAPRVPRAQQRHACGHSIARSASGASTTPRAGRRTRSELVTQLGSTSFVIVALDRRRALRVPARSEPLGAGLPRDRRRRRDRPRQHDQGDPRPRPARRSTRSPRRSGRRSRAATPAWPQPSTRPRRSRSRASGRPGRARSSPAAPSRSRSPSRAAACCSASTGCPT